MTKQTSSFDVAQTAKVLRALASDCRLEVMFALKIRERNVTELSSMLNMSQSALSQHLAKLRTLGLVHTRRDAQMIYYSVADARVASLLDTLVDIYGPRKMNGVGRGENAREAEHLNVGNLPEATHKGVPATH